MRQIAEIFNPVQRHSVDIGINNLLGGEFK